MNNLKKESWFYIIISNFFQEKNGLPNNVYETSMFFKILFEKFFAHPDNVCPG